MATCAVNSGWASIIGVLVGIGTALLGLPYAVVLGVLAPRISGHAVGLHPLGAMFALLGGFQLAGLLGLFAVPLAGVLWVLLSAGYRNVLAEPRAPKRRLLPVPRFHRPGWKLGSDVETGTSLPLS